MPVGPSTTDRLDGVNEGIAAKAPVRVATTSNIVLSGEQTIDGIACVDGDRVLVKNQTDTTTNGIYDVSSGTWSRSLDADGNRDLVKGSRVFVNSGSANGVTGWYCSSSNPIIIDTDAITWVEFENGVSGGPTSTTGVIEVVIDGGAATITTGLKGYVSMAIAGTITEAKLIGDRSGSIVVNVWKCTYAQFDASSTHPVAGDKITASAPPTISSATKSSDATLTGWTTAFSAGDIFAFNVDSVTSIQRATLALKYTT